MSSTQSQARWSYELNCLSGVKFDSLFILGVLAVALISGFVVWNEPSLFAPILLLDLWFLGYHHVISTFTKLAGTPQDREENKFLIYYLPVIVIAAVAALAAGVGLWSIITIYFFWQWYHYTRQSYGISAFYRRKAETPVKEHPYLSQATLWCIPIWGILYRCAQQWETFLYQPFWTPAVPWIVVTFAGIVTCLLLGYWTATRLVAFYNGTLPLGHTLFMVSHFTAFYVGYVLIPDINTGWLVANIWHNAQYILFVWLYNTKRFSKPSEHDKTFVAWASQMQPVRILSYFVGCMLLTTAVYKGITVSYQVIIGPNVALLTTLYVVTFQTINFHHYIVDSMIWKARKKTHQKVMGIKTSE